MGVGEVILLFMVLFSFCSSASLAPLSKNSVSENMQENVGNEGIEEHGNSRDSGRHRRLVNQSKYAHAGGTAGGGHSPVQGENGNGGQSQSQGGGTAVIPVYTAGAAANQRRNHHSAADTSIRCFKSRLPVLIAATSASLLLHIPM